MPYRLLIIAFVSLSLLAACANNPFARNPATTPPERPTREAPPPQQMASAAERAKLHTDLGSGYYERGQMDVAIGELNTAVKLDPNYAPAYNIYGLIYAVLGEDRKAEQNFERALALAPNNPDIHHNWGWYLCQHKREREALAQFETRRQRSVVPDAGDRAGQRRPLRAGDRRRARRRRVFPARALRTAEQRAGELRACPDRLQGRPLRRGARRDAARDARRTIAPPEALRLGMCVERKLGDRQSEASYIVAVAQPLSGRAGNAGDRRGLRVMDLEAQPAGGQRARAGCVRRRRSAAQGRARGRRPFARPGGAAAQAGAAPGQGARGRELRHAAGQDVHARLHAQLRPAC